MRELLVLAGKRDSPVATGGDVAVWDRLDVAEGQISVPGTLHARLKDIRRELMAWDEWIISFISRSSDDKICCILSKVGIFFMWGRPAATRFNHKINNKKSSEQKFML